MGIVKRLAGPACVAVFAGCGGGSDREPEFELSLRVDGVMASRMPLGEGGEASVDVSDGSRIELRASEPVDWSSDLGGASVADAAEGATSKSLVLSRPGAVGTTSVFEARAQSASERWARVHVAIAPRQFPARPRVVGEYSEWRSTLTRQDGSTSGSAYREEVRQIGPPDLALIVTTRQSDGRPTAYREVDGQERTVSYAEVSYDDAGNDYPSSCHFDPAVVAYRFPLSVGASWSAPWSTTHCIDAAEGSGQAAGEVQAWEPVAVPAGRFDALRIHAKLAPEVPNAGGFARSESVCWWSVELGRPVKCSIALLDPTSGQVRVRLVNEMTAFGGP